MAARGWMLGVGGWGLGVRRAARLGAPSGRVALGARHEGETGRALVRDRVRARARVRVGVRVRVRVGLRVRVRVRVRVGVRVRVRETGRAHDSALPHGESDVQLLHLPRAEGGVTR